MSRASSLALAFALALAGCQDHGVPAEVQLTIDGQDHSYATTHAEFDRQTADGPYSAYLLRGDGEAPYFGLRYYSGNPVARLVLRQLKPGDAEGTEPAKYECFVPGTLSDGRPTLGWTQDDGSARHIGETGEATCQAALTEAGGTLTLEFDAVLTRSLSKKQGRSKRAKTELDPSDQIRAKGSATLRLR